MYVYIHMYIYKRETSVTMCCDNISKNKKLLKNKTLNFGVLSLRISCLFFENQFYPNNHKIKQYQQSVSLPKSFSQDLYIYYQGKASAALHYHQSNTCL